MNSVDLKEVPLTTKEVMARCRSVAASVLVIVVTAQLFYQNKGYKNAFQFHPICMMVAFVMVLPDVVTGVKRLKSPRKTAAAGTSGSIGTAKPIDANLPRDEVILRHQLAAFVMEMAAGGGFAAVEYTKISNGWPHLTSPHGIVGALCGAAILCQMMLGSAMRYVLKPGHPTYRKVRTAHKLASLTIIVTGLMAMMGGFLATPYAAQMIPSSAVRNGIAVAAVGCTVIGLFM